MNLAPKAREVEDNPHFDKVFEQTAQEEAREKEARKNKENEKQEKGPGSTAHETASDRTNDKLKAGILCSAMGPNNASDGVSICNGNRRQSKLY